MSTDNQTVIALPIPVVEAVAATIESSLEERLPRASVVAPAKTCQMSISAVKGIAEKEISIALIHERNHSATQLSSFRCELMSEVRKTVHHDAAVFLNNYTTKELPEVINSRINILFPLFLDGDSAAKKHLSEHLAAMDKLLVARKIDLAAELAVVAIEVAGAPCSLSL